MIRAHLASPVVSRRSLWPAAATALALAWVSLIGCSGSVVDGGGGCAVGHELFAPGDTFPAPDGCNTCSCSEDGSVGCTEMACEDGCIWLGEHHAFGESFPAGDGCNTCSCDGGGLVGCTLIACEETCTWLGETHFVGESFPAGDGCNTCSCEEGGFVGCTEIWCEMECVYAGNTYQPGDTFPALDGCNTCTCGPGGAVGCTKVECPCNPEAEWWLHYVGESVEECELIDFGCPPNTDYFGNECGCGCQQDLACPQYFDCEPPAMCDVEALKEQCPYSGFAL